MKSPLSRLPVSRRAGAFTLIELLTVIAIIGILAAILIPTVGRVRESARTSQCASNLRQAAMAIRLFGEDNRGVLPAANNPAGQLGDVNKKSWSEAIDSYLPKPANTSGRHAVLSCPSNNYTDAGANPSRPIALTYTMGPGSAFFDTAINDVVEAKGRPMTSITNPSQAIWLLEGKIDSTSWNTPRNVVYKAGLGRSFETPGPGATSDVQFWHGGEAKTNIVLGDGSVRCFDTTDFNSRYPAVTTPAGIRRAAGL